MAKARHQLDLLCTRAVLCARRNSKLGLVLVIVCLLGLVLGSPFYWLFKDRSDYASCGSCDCGCPPETLLPIPLDFINSSLYADCSKQDPDTRQEMGKDPTTLLSEELNLLKMIENDNLQRTKSLLSDVSESSKAYKNEYEKCNIATKINEEAREKAEAELTKELKLSALWEARARELGWIDEEVAAEPV